MIDKIATWLAKVPTVLAGLALGVASLGLCWESGATFKDKHK
jgi:hypothetical protein